MQEINACTKNIFSYRDYLHKDDMGKILEKYGKIANNFAWEVRVEN